YYFRTYVLVCSVLGEFPTEPVTREAHPYPHRCVPLCFHGRVYDIPCEASARLREADSDQVPASISPRIVRWYLPPPGRLKLNVDGAYKISSGTAAGGGILGNGIGDIIFAFAASYPNVHSSLEAEALALRDGVLLCIERGVTDFLIESDSLVLVQVMKSGSTGVLGEGISRAEDEGVVGVISGGLTTGGAGEVDKQLFLEEAWELGHPSAGFHQKRAAGQPESLDPFLLLAQALDLQNLFLELTLGAVALEQ
ncbi:hypothetical protein Taro_056053, partial [Colocasia esculenta]|nr:hypothetical protein [Colocasia esculenta]